MTAPSGARGRLLLWVPLLLAVAIVAVIRPRLANVIAKVRETSSAYPLPPPEQLTVACLGYRAATADILWAYVLVAQGLRMSEHRRFEHGALYFESISTLDPTFREPYLYLDAILTFGAVRATHEDVDATRALFERGLAARPTDAPLHLQAGNFFAYIAPGYLQKEDEQKAWRLAGAKLLQRAAELGTGQNDLQWHALAGAAVLSRNGEREAAIGFLERSYAVTDDEELRGKILDNLRALQGERVALRARQTATQFETTWREELPFISRGKILLLGPHANPWECAGIVKANARSCARDWQSWTQQDPSPHEAPLSP